MLKLGGYLVMIITAVNFFRSFTYVNVHVKQSGYTLSHKGEEEYNEIPATDGFATVPLSAFSFSGKNYVVIPSLFEQAGFTNVKTVPLHDLRKGFFRRSEEGTNGFISSIHINGKSLTFFKRTFPINTSVVISYYSF